MHKALIQQYLGDFLLQSEGILNNEILDFQGISQESQEELIEKLQASTFLGIAEIIKLLEGQIPEELTEFLERRRPYEYLNESRAKPRVRTSVLECIATMLEFDVINEGHISQMSQIVYSKIADQNRNVQRILWVRTLPLLQQKYPSALEQVPQPKVLENIQNCLKNAAYGAADAMYLSLFNILRSFDKACFNLKQINALMNSILQGLQSEDLQGCGKLLINSYYEVIILLFVTKSELRVEICDKIMEPVNRYLDYKSSLIENNPITAVPQALRDTISQITSNNLDIPDVFWEKLHEKCQISAQQGSENVVRLLHGLSEGQQQLNSNIQNIIISIHTLLQTNIGEIIENQSSDLSQLNARLEQLCMFREYLGKLSPPTDHVPEWWHNELNNHEITQKLCRLLWTQPQMWLELVYELKVFPDFLEKMYMLVPSTPNAELKKVAQSDQCQQIPAELLDYINSEERNDFILKSTDLLQKWLNSGLLSMDTIQAIYQQMQTYEADWQQSNILKLNRVLNAFSQYLTESDVTIIARFLSKYGWQPELKTTWDLVHKLSEKETFSELMRDSLAKELSNSLQGGFITWANCNVILQQVLQLPDEAVKVVQSLFDQEGLFDPMNIECWRSLEKFFGYIEPEPWLIAELLAAHLIIDVAPSSQEDGNQTPVNTARTMLLQQKLTQLANKIDVDQITTEVLRKMIEKLDRGEAYSQALITTIHKVSIGISEEKAMDIYNSIIPELGSDSRFTHIFCEVLGTLKPYHRQQAELVQQADIYLEQCRKDPSPKNLMLFAAYIIDPNPEYIECIDLALQRSLTPEDFFLINEISRLLGFMQIQDYIPQIEASLINFLHQKEGLLALLPYTRRLLAYPEFINDKQGLSDAIIDLTLQKLSEAQTIEVAETLIRLNSITGPRINEAQLYLALTVNQHPFIHKSIYTILSQTYQGYRVIRIQEDAETGDPLSQSILDLLKLRPELYFKEIVSPQMFGYLMGWLLLIEKWVTEKNHAEVSEYAVCLKSYLDESLDCAKNLMEILLQYLPERNQRLPDSFEASWTDICDPTSVGFLAYKILLEFMSAFPALTRLWWTFDDKRLTGGFKFAMLNNISPQIFNREIELIDKRRPYWQCDELSIRVSPKAKEVIANYDKDEIKLEIRLKVPDVYPLSPIEINVQTGVKLPKAKIRKWQMGMVKVFNQENAYFLDALVLFKENLNKEIEGVEECHICYYIVHTGDRSLPNMPCKNCKNKFHGPCIRKWFKTSSKNVCPLCQVYFWG